MSNTEFRNVAIVAHVDHGKTTLVNGMLEQSGAFGDLLVVLGLGTFVVALAGWQPSLPLVGAGLLLFAGASVAVRYALQKRRG